MSVSVTAESSVRVTVSLAMATPFVATSRRVPPTVTKKSPGAGTESAFSAVSKVMPRVTPSTVALRNTGGVALVTASSAKVATAASLALPSSGLVPGWV